MDEQIKPVVWRPVVGDGRYEVSSCGSVRRATTGRALKPWAHKSGHLYITLSRVGKRQVHRLVLEAFVGPAPDGMECRHLDGYPTNNGLENLEWGTRRQNIEDLKSSSGRYAKASLSDAQAVRVRGMFRGVHGDQSRIARELGLSLSMVNRLIRGKTYGHLER